MCVLLLDDSDQLPVSALIDYEHWWQPLVLAGQIGAIVGLLSAGMLSTVLFRKLGLPHPVLAGFTATLVTAPILAAQHGATEGGPWTAVPMEYVFGIMLLSLLMSYAAIASLAPAGVWVLGSFACAGSAGLVTLSLLGELT